MVSELKRAAAQAMIVEAAPVALVFSKVEIPCQTAE